MGNHYSKYLGFFALGLGGVIGHCGLPSDHLAMVQFFVRTPISWTDYTVSPSLALLWSCAWR